MFINSLPNDLIILIYSFDRTYREIFDDILKDVKRITMIYNYYRSKGYEISFKKK